MVVFFAPKIKYGAIQSTTLVVSTGSITAYGVYAFPTADSAILIFQDGSGTELFRVLMDSDDDLALNVPVLYSNGLQIVEAGGVGCHVTVILGQDGA